MKVKAIGALTVEEAAGIAHSNKGEEKVIDKMELEQSSEVDLSKVR